MWGSNSLKNNFKGRLPWCSHLSPHVLNRSRHNIPSTVTHTWGHERPPWARWGHLSWPSSHYSDENVSNACSLKHLHLLALLLCYRGKERTPGNPHWRVKVDSRVKKYLSVYLTKWVDETNQTHKWQEVTRTTGTHLIHPSAVALVTPFFARRICSGYHPLLSTASPSMWRSMSHNALHFSFLTLCPLSYPALLSILKGDVLSPSLLSGKVYTHTQHTHARTHALCEPHSSCSSDSISQRSFVATADHSWLSCFTDPTHFPPSSCVRFLVSLPHCQ